MDISSSTIEPLTEHLGPRRPWYRQPLRIWPYTLSSLAWFVAAYLAMVTAWTAAGLAITTWLEPSSLGSREVDLNRWFERQRSESLDPLAHVGSGPSDTVVVIATMAVLLVAFPLVWRRWHGWAFLVGALALEGAVYASSNYLVGRPRPPVEQMEEIVTDSFPSGHVAAAVAFYLGLVIVVFWHTASRVARALAAVGGVLVPLVVATSRLYLGVHYLTDLVAGALLGLTSVIVAMAIARRGLAEQLARSPEPAPPHTTRLDLTAR